MAWLLWLVAAVVLMIAELFSLDFVLIMFSLGAFAASISAGLGVPLVAQSLIFAVVSILALLVLRPLARRAMMSRSDRTPIGLDALIGSQAVVIKQVDEFSGLVKIAGEEWSARSTEPQQNHKPGEKVQVVEVKGATVLVRRQSS